LWSSTKATNAPRTPKQGVASVMARLPSGWIEAGTGRSEDARERTYSRRGGVSRDERDQALEPSPDLISFTSPLIVEAEYTRGG
jgi:hypothetical protein